MGAMRRVGRAVLGVVGSIWWATGWGLFFGTYDLVALKPPWSWALAAFMFASVPYFWWSHIRRKRRHEQFMALMAQREAQHLARLDAILATADDEVRQIFGLPPR